MYNNKSKIDKKSISMFMNVTISGWFAWIDQAPLRFLFKFGLLYFISGRDYNWTLYTICKKFRNA